MNGGGSFGPYRVVRKLGQGGMGAVYLGEHTLIGRRAAIKVLHKERSVQREVVERFFNEARATSAMQDPGIVHVYDFGVTDDGIAYLIMEYLSGEPLSARVRRLGALHPADAVRITRQIAGSLAAAHAAGIVHRDLKPENLFMVRDAEAIGGERPKILDFGIAKLGDERVDRFRTRTGAVMGTPAYMSPEQCNDTGKIDHRTDVYSLGCVLFHLLTGRPPFDFDGAGAMIAAHLREQAPVPSRVSSRVPEILDPIVARCLAKSPEDRYASMSELQQVCDAVLAQLPAPPPLGTDERIAPHTVRDDSVTTLGHSAGQSSAVDARALPRRIWVAIAGVAIIAGVVLALATKRGGSEREPAVAPVAPSNPSPAREDPGAGSAERSATGSGSDTAEVTPEPSGSGSATAEVTAEPSGSGSATAEVTPEPSGSGSELGAAPASAVPSKKPDPRPPRTKPPKKRRPVDSYEDRF